MAVFKDISKALSQLQTDKNRSELGRALDADDDDAARPSLRGGGGGREREWCVWWWCGRLACMTCLSVPHSSMQRFRWQVTWESDSWRSRHPFPARMAGVNPGPVPVHTTLQAHVQPPEMHLRHPIEQAEHLHDFHDLWHDATISSTTREQKLRDIAVFCTRNHRATVVAHNGV